MKQLLRSANVHRHPRIRRRACLVYGSARESLGSRFRRRTTGRLCPRCGKQSSFETTGHRPITFDGGTAHPSDGQPYATFDERATGFVCRHCRQGFVVVESEWRGGTLLRENPNNYGAVTWRWHHWWPVPGAVLHDSVPAPVRSAFDEACGCLASDCPRAWPAFAGRPPCLCLTDSVYSGPAVGPV